LYAPYEEFLEVARLVKKYDRVLTVHNRAQSKVSTSYNPPIGGRAHNLRAIDEMVRLVRTTGVKLQNSHLIFVGKKTFGTVDETIKLIDDCNREGCDFGFDIFSLTYGASIITVILPGWYLELSPEKRKSLPVKIRLWAEIFIARKTLGLDFCDIKIANGAGLIDEFEGMYITEIAEKLNMSPYQAYIYLVDK
jgi:N-acyl-D-amino-acid deacylase